MDQFHTEVSRGDRFQFGRNWKRFLSTLNEDRISEAVRSLTEMLEISPLEGKSFLDAGSGSGLFSLAARRLGLSVFSFDFDPESVACTRELQERYFPKDPDWQITQGSVLDKPFLRSLGQFDIVYSWGVLHHTGRMWEALENVCSLVKRQGHLFIAIYNDQGVRSRLWRQVKRVYCSGNIGRGCVCGLFIPYFFMKALLKSLLLRQNAFAQYKTSRGMSILYDWFDWLGGYPYEVAKADDILDALRERGFQLTKLKTTNRQGNNQFVFVKT